MWWPGEASLIRGHPAETQTKEAASPEVLGKRDGKCKGPEVGACRACLKNSKNTTTAGAEPTGKQKDWAR